jgi:hypothetical protein
MPLPGVTSLSATPARRRLPDIKNPLWRRYQRQGQLRSPVGYLLVQPPAAVLRSASSVSCGAPSGRPGTGWCRSQFAERFASNPASPAHPRNRSLGMITKLLRHPSGTAALAEFLDSGGDGLPDLPGTGMVTALQRRHE